MSLRNYANKEKYYDDNHKKLFFLHAELEPNTLICQKKFQRTQEHIFTFLMDTTKHGEMERNGAVRIKSNQN